VNPVSYGKRAVSQLNSFLPHSHIVHTRKYTHRPFHMTV